MLLSNLIRSLVLVFALSAAANEVDAVVDINTADAQTLADVLVGVGPSKARAIVEYRDKNGRFSDPYDLTYVKGIGEATVEKNEERIRLK